MTSAQQAILTDLKTHGPATAAVIAERTGLGYSTVTASLRKIAGAGQVHRDDTSTWTVAEPAGPTETTTPAATDPAFAAADPAEHGGSADPTTPATRQPDDHAEPQPERAELAAADHDPDEPAAAAQSQPEQAEEPEPADDNETTGPNGPDEDHPISSPATTSAIADSGQPAAVPEDTPRRRYTRSGKPVRKKHQLQTEVLAYLTAHPGQQLTPHTIGKAIDAADGAVINACNKLAHDAKIQRVETTKAMFIYAPDDTTDVS
ncbi:hypothetical protein AB0H43_13705 [Hamadaea sp. NPDC050747]|uniref:hypothetical protein n=1 Tax=Hamadaea sp. NPDC050747 TaxID=3155789 RepID=UPI0033CE6527